MAEMKKVMKIAGTMGVVVHAKTTDAQEGAGVGETMWPALPGADVLVTVTTLPTYDMSMKVSKSRYDCADFKS